MIITYQFLVNYKRLLEEKARIEEGGSPRILSHIQEKSNEAGEFPHHTSHKTAFTEVFKSGLVVSTPLNYKLGQRNIFREAPGLGKDRLSHLIRFMYK